MGVAQQVRTVTNCVVMQSSEFISGVVGDQSTESTRGDQQLGVSVSEVP